MALPTTGPMTADMIMQQYGGTAPFRISDYYRGGARVPNIAANSGIPTSGTITFANFRGQGGSGGGGLSATSSPASGTQFRNEPAPATVTVSSLGNVVASGGTGSYTCTWAHLSGSATIPTPAANVFNPSFSLSVAKNSTVSAVKRCTVSDGVNSVFTDMTVNLSYFTNQ